MENKYDVYTKAIKRIDFDILSNNEILKMSVFGEHSDGVFVPELYQELEPKKDGLNDPRMGVVDNSSVCGTCRLSATYCPGHFGHITLAEKIFHTKFLSYVEKILNCVCIKCSNLLIDKKKSKTIGKNKLAEIIKETNKIDACRVCGTPKSKIKKDIKKQIAQINLVAEYNIKNTETGEEKKISLVLSPEICYNILHNISDEDWGYMGFKKNNRPESMIIKNLPVPPLQVRPSVRLDTLSSSTMEDGLTRKLADVVKTNIRISQQKQKGKLNEYWQTNVYLVQYHVSTYMNNESTTLYKAEQKGQPIKSLETRLKGKEGRIRGNLMGKRVDFSGRSVITPDPTIDINELGVPLKIAMNLTFPETVTKYNIERLTTNVKFGRHNYPGANYITQYTYKLIRKDLRFNKEKIELQIGDIVERHLIDGDIVLLNRQPSLHKHSMMGHFVKVSLDPRIFTFRIALAVTGAYNADFDGDEMNIFVPQSIQTLIELEELVDVKNIIVSPSTGKPEIGITYDGLCGSYIMTKPNSLIDGKTAMDLLSYVKLNNFPKLDKNKFYTGHEIFSFIIPPNINARWQDGTVIKNGKLLTGFLKKEILGAKKNNSLLQLILDSNGPDDTKTLMDNIQRLINNYLVYKGFTVGITDVMVNNEKKEKIQTIINTKVLKCQHMITDMENNPDLREHKLFEDTLFAENNTVLTDVSKFLMNVTDDNNNVKIMIKSGSKGSAENLGQMSGNIGMQQHEGKMMPKLYNKRSLPYYHENDDTPFARGLANNSFLDGISYEEHVSHSGSAREGLMDTAMKTSKSGYLQKKFVKTTENNVVQNDGTVRTSNGLIIQFMYGGSNADTTKQYDYNIKMINMNDEELEKIHKFTDNELSKFNNYKKYNDDIFNRIKKYRDLIRIIQLKSALEYIVLNPIVLIPVNIKRIVENAINEPGTEKIVKPIHVLNGISKILYDTNTLCISKKDRYNKNTIKYEDEVIVKTILKIVLFDSISPKKCVKEYKLSTNVFDKLVETIIKNYNNNLIEAGTPVGIIASQALGHCVTQMTLNTFHYSGISSKSASMLGVPRLTEILNVSKNIKTPQMILYLLDEYNNNKNMANQIRSQIESTFIQDICDRTDVYYDPYPNEENSFMHLDNVFNIFEISSDKKKTYNIDNLDPLPLLIRLEINREKMYEKNITLLDIKSNFVHQLEKNKTFKKEDINILNKILNYTILSNNDNDIIPIIHIRLDITNYSIEIIESIITLFLEKFQLKGISRIKYADINSENVVSFDEKGNINKNNQFVIYTSGINMNDIRYFHGIDFEKTMCNDIVLVNELFGIEAARAMIIKEITSQYRNSGQNVNYQHIALIADVMTRNGNIISVDRNGMNKTDASILTAASFEKAPEHFVNASVWSESDNMKSVSAKIMVGNIISSGTGLCDFLLDDELLENSEYIEEMHDTTHNIQENAIVNDIINKQVTGFMPE